MFLENDKIEMKNNEKKEGKMQSDEK